MDQAGDNRGEGAFVTYMKSKREVLQWAYKNRLFFSTDWKDVRREANTAIKSDADPVQAVIKAGLASQSSTADGFCPDE